MLPHITTEVPFVTERPEAAPPAALNKFCNTAVSPPVMIAMAAVFAAVR